MTSAQITVEQWLEIRKEAGLQIDPETAKVRWEYALNSTLMGLTQIFRRSGSKSDGNTSRVLREVAFGCGLAIYLRRREMLYGAGKLQD